jgi:phosphate acyltransferase
MVTAVRIAVDCMGGDHGLSVTIPACIAFANAHSDTQLVLVGREADVLSELTRCGVPADRFEVVNATEMVAMDDAPAIALRTKKDSSIRVGAELVKSGRARALVSSGNTGALMAISRFVLKMLESIDRPAIAAQMPQISGGTVTVLDVGANVDCSPEHYLQFGIMGAALVQALDGTTNPRVGLLNIGAEAIKGSEVVKDAGILLRDSGLNFIGNVEGDEIAKGGVDVIVCDGFVGNIALKTTEGVAKMLSGFLKEEFSRSIFTKLMYLVASPVLKRFKNRVDPRRYNGASLIGLRGIVIKSHGSSDAIGFEHALRRAHDAVSNDLVGKIEQSMALLKHTRSHAVSDALVKNAEQPLSSAPELGHGLPSPVIAEVPGQNPNKSLAA